MTWSSWLWLALIALGFLYWLFNLFVAVRTVRAVPVLAALSPAPPVRWPRLSLIVPACNEATTLEAAMKSKLAEGYPDLEVVLVDDRSTDGTGEIVDRLAAGDPRVVSLHIRELPPGWLGKLNALNTGLARSSGEWLLFSDADIHYEPGTLRRAIAFCEERGVDHLAILPSLWSTGLVLDTIKAGFIRFIILGARAWKIPDPHSRASIGIGAFNLVRRSALERTPGFEWLRLEVADDLALGQMLKRSGAKSAVVNGRGLVGLYYFETFRELVRSAEKGGTLFRFNPFRALATGIVLLWFELSPLLGLLPFGPPAARILGACALGASVASSLLINRFMGHPLLPALLVPVGSVLNVAVLVWSGLISARRGGIAWRGTLYPAQQLLEGRRFTLT